MDPSTTLVTFFLQTHPSVQSVHLVGSWDNFSSYYPMERDSRRGQGQWKGCHTFRDIIREDDSKSTSTTSSPRRRQGGLRMDSTYYYYYEVDRSSETFDYSRPNTTTCPWLPGQRVNMMSVPRERSLRTRSASLSSMRQTDFKTMDPQSKFTSPRPMPIITVASSEMAVPTPERKHSGGPPPVRPTTSYGRSISYGRASSRSNSPAPAWKRFFGHKLSKAEDADARGRSPDRLDSDDQSLDNYCTVDDNRSVASSHRSRQRSISPESLRRFLVDETPSRSSSRQGDLQPLVIPEEIEDGEDDDNFAASAVSETQLDFTTSLSPPPSQRSGWLETVPLTTANLSSLTLTAEQPEIQGPYELAADEVSVEQTTHLSPPSYASSGMASPMSPRSLEDEMLTFYEESNDEDEDVIGQDDHDTPRAQRFEGYSLPQNDVTIIKLGYSSPQLAGSEAGSFPGTEGSNLLGAHVDSGLDDFVNELGWMVNSISTKHI